MSYYARFWDDNAGRRFRFDTRIYLCSGETPHEHGGECVGAVVANNPGSARPWREDDIGKWARIKGDSTLGVVRSCFIDAYALAGRPIPQNAFIQMWNLFYLRNSNIKEACRQVAANSESCPTESIRSPKVIWYAWGKDDEDPDIARLVNKMKVRFASQDRANGFYFGHKNRSGDDSESALILEGAPSESDFVKHPRGLLTKRIQIVLQIKKMLIL
jgi:hypothetical protein